MQMRARTAGVTRRFALRLIGIAVLTAGWLPATTPTVAAASICDVTDPAGWNVIAEASSTATGQQFVCNYRVDRPSGQSGTAITIEYYCTPEDASERYAGIVGDRDTVTTPSGAPPGMLIIEEGKQARNPVNPQSSGVFSSFFPGVEFGLFEKEWRLLNQQVLATIVVLTNERGVVAEDKRYGVDDAEAVARVLANRNRAGAGCPIPEVPLAGIAGAAGGGAPVIPILVGTGGVIVVIGGTRLIWRRKSQTPRPSPNIGQVPDACGAAKVSYEDSRERLQTLRDATQEMSEQLRRAEIIHANNIIKANMVVGFEVGTVIGGTVSDLTQAVTRPRGSAHPQQIDTWKPPSRIGAKMAQALQMAEEALELARSKVKVVADEVALLRTKIDEMIENSTAVRNARDLQTYWFNKLEAALTDLPKATAARKQWAELDELATKQSGLVARGAAVRAPLQRAVLQGAAELEGLEALGQKAAAPIKEELAELDKAMKAIDESRTMGPGGKKLPLGADRARRIERMQEMRGELVEKLGEVELEHGRKISEHKANLEATRKQLKDLDDQPGWKELLADRDRTSARLQDATTQLNQLEEVTEADVLRYKAQADKYASELLEARSAAKAQEFTDADHLARRLEQARFNEELARDALNNLRRNAESIEVGATPRIPEGAEQGWSIGRMVRWPFRVFGELVFGVGQSPEEIVADPPQGVCQHRAAADGFHGHLGGSRGRAWPCHEAPPGARRLHQGTEGDSWSGCSGGACGTRARRRREPQMTGTPSNRPTLVPVTLQLVPKDGPGSRRWIGKRGRSASPMRSPRTSSRRTISRTRSASFPCATKPAGRGATTARCGGSGTVPPGASAFRPGSCNSSPSRWRHRRRRRFGATPRPITCQSRAWPRGRDPTPHCSPNRAWPPVSTSWSPSNARTAGHTSFAPMNGRRGSTAASSWRT